MYHSPIIELNHDYEDHEHEINKKTVEPWGSVFSYQKLQLYLYTTFILQLDKK